MTLIGRYRFLQWTLVPYFCIAIGGSLRAQIMLQSSNFSSGTATIQSQSFVLKGNIGQPVTGSTSSNGFMLHSGYALSPIERLPDLIITQINVNPSAASIGQEVTISFTIKNNGAQAAAGKVNAKAYLSLNATLDESDILFAAFDVTTDLASGTSYSFPGTDQSARVKIATSIPLNAYGVLLLVDPDNVVTERNELNNREPEV